MHTYLYSPLRPPDYTLCACQFLPSLVFMHLQIKGIARTGIFMSFDFFCPYHGIKNITCYSSLSSRIVKYRIDPSIHFPLLSPDQGHDGGGGRGGGRPSQQIKSINNVTQLKAVFASFFNLSDIH